MMAMGGPSKFSRQGKIAVSYICMGKMLEKSFSQYVLKKRSKEKVQGVPQSQTAALPRHQEEEETDKIKKVQIEQMYEKHQD